MGHHLGGHLKTGRTWSLQTGQRSGSRTRVFVFSISANVFPRVSSTRFILALGPGILPGSDKSRESEGSAPPVNTRRDDEKSKAASWESAMPTPRSPKHRTEVIINFRTEPIALVVRIAVR